MPDYSPALSLLAVLWAVPNALSIHILWFRACRYLSIAPSIPLFLFQRKKIFLLYYKECRANGDRVSLLFWFWRLSNPITLALIMSGIAFLWFRKLGLV